MKQMLRAIAVLLLICSTLIVTASAPKFSIVPQTVLPAKPKAAKPNEYFLATRLVNLSAKEYGEIRGKKLSFFERLVFKSAKKKMLRKMKKQYAEDETTGFNLGGYALGIILGPLGVIGAYIFSSDRNFRKWAWWGLLGWISIALLLIASVF